MSREHRTGLEKALSGGSGRHHSLGAEAYEPLPSAVVSRLQPPPAATSFLCCLPGPCR